jgi:ABC-type glutathione transport system ATPase component
MFGTTRGIEGLDLRLEPGEIFGFLGPNGAGKTTTVRALLDLQRPTAGTALGDHQGGRLVRTDTVDGLRRDAPTTLALIPGPVDPAVFLVDRVRVLEAAGAHLTLEATGAIGPVLRIAADLDLVGRRRAMLGYISAPRCTPSCSSPSIPRSSTRRARTTSPRTPQTAIDPAKAGE